MLALPADGKVVLYLRPMDLRKGFDGLTAVVVEEFSLPVTSAACFAFLNRRKDRMKVLYWDGDGLAIWYKRPERGSFSCSLGDCSEANKTALQYVIRSFFLFSRGNSPIIPVMNVGLKSSRFSLNKSKLFVISSREEMQE